jgi:hypothetical protein
MTTRSLAVLALLLGACAGDDALEADAHVTPDATSASYYVGEYDLVWECAEAAGCTLDTQYVRLTIGEYVPGEGAMLTWHGADVGIGTNGTGGFDAESGQFILGGIGDADSPRALIQMRVKPHAVGFESVGGARWRYIDTIEEFTLIGSRR